MVIRVFRVGVTCERRRKRERKREGGRKERKEGGRQGKRKEGKRKQLIEYPKHSIKIQVLHT